MLTLAIPSKGRLQEQVAEYFADAGLPIKKSGARGYSATVAGQPDIDVRLLSASEISTALIEGDIHMGVTGEDLMREASPSLDGLVTLIAPLGFGYANVVVAVPEAWIDVTTMHDLDDVCAAFAQRHKRRLRIATKYVHITRAFFARHGIADYRIVESSGATEGAPASGSAEAIVDITTTGATLVANGLKILEDGTILESQAQLAASLNAPWNAVARSAAETLLSRIAAREKAKSSQVIRVRLNGKAESVLAALAATGTTTLSQSGDDYALVCPRKNLMAAIALLKASGSGAATVEEVDYLFEPSNTLYAKIEAALRQA
jgi:ATP phosphoribosyltransferase